MNTEESTKEFRVASSTNCTELASGMFQELTKEPPTKLIIKVVGASALNQAIKAVATLNSSLSTRGKYASVIPYFGKVKFRDEEKEHTSIELKVMEHRL